MNRRNFLIKGIGTAICAGLTPYFIPSLLPESAFSAVQSDVGGKVSTRTLAEIFKSVYGDIVVLTDSSVPAGTIYFSNVKPPLYWPEGGVICPMTPNSPT